MLRPSLAPEAVIDHVQFGILSPEVVLSMSVLEVVNQQTDQGGVLQKGGLLDPLMGPDRHTRCLTCSGDYQECPGHFGHITLENHVYHYGFLPLVLKILRCVCCQCSKLLVDKADPRLQRVLQMKNPRNRLREIMKMTSNAKTCGSGDEVAKKDGDEKQAEEAEPTEEGAEDKKKKKPRRPGCGAAQPKFMRSGLGIKRKTVKSDTEAATDTPFSASEAFEVLRKISDEDCRIMGLNPKLAHPSWMVLKVLPVPPPAVRPSIMLDSSRSSKDDLTYKLSDIIQANNLVRSYKQKGSANHTLANATEVLQWTVATYFDNTIPGQPLAKQKSGKPVKSISQRLKGKEGRIRGNLMGKRVDFSARTVITPDPLLSIDQVGVPKSIALNMTYPERVTPFNIEQLQKMVDNGPDTHPGARYFVRAADGEQFDLRHVHDPHDKRLAIGDIVERHIMDGDFILFNRQPSLHKMSIMGHRIKIMPYSSFRLNLSCTTPYNADFDGDEMNLHVPQSQETRAETRELMMVQRQIVTPASNKPVISVVQDALLGSRNFTKRDSFLEKDLLMNCLMWIPNWDGVIPEAAILKPRPLWTGKQVFSRIIPAEINLERTSGWHPDPAKDPENANDPLYPLDSVVIIENGELICGTLCKKTLGNGTGSLIHVIWKDKGPEAAKEFLNNTQRVINYWLLQHGFTIGIQDTIADVATLRNIMETIKQAQEKVTQLIKLFIEDKLDEKPGKTKQESFEIEVNKALNEATNTAGSSAQKSLSDRNNIKNIVSGGSKGSNINVSQIIACVGQQNVEGKRIPYGFHQRTLPHFTANDNGAESRGFVENSYLRGLTPQEFFFHTMGGREGLIDTAVKTSETGYIQRRLVKAMEDVSIRYDGTVRNSIDEVVQFAYGEDGMSGEFMETQKFEILTLADKKFVDKFRFPLDGLALTATGSFKSDALRQLEVFLQREVVEQLEDPRALEILREEFAQLQEDRQLMRTEIMASGEPSWPMPVNITRLMWTAKKKFAIDVKRPTALSPVKVVTEVRKLGQRLVVVPGKDSIAEEAQKNATLLFNVLLRSMLNSYVITKEHRLTPEAFDWLLGEIATRFQQASAHPGEMVGPIAAQSIGEPATQMTLNTFHYAGVSAKNVTLGVPRLKELINVAKKTRTPSLTVFLRSPYSDTMDGAMEVQSEISYCTLRHVTAQSEIWYDPDEQHTVIPEDDLFVKTYYEIEELPQKMSPWLLRLVLDRPMMMAHKLQMHDIADKIREHFSGDLHCIFSDDNAEKLVVRLRMVQENKDDAMSASEDDIFLKKVEVNMLQELTLKGIPDIKKVSLRESKRTIIKPDGTYGTQNEWVLETDGCNLAQVMCHEKVDPTRTITNNIIEAAQVLGIEAVRNTLLKELRQVIEFDGSYVNYRHLALLADVMTSRGYLMAITRHGINRQDTGPLLRCSFEETVDMLNDAAGFAELDRLTGVSSNIMLGQIAPVGTGTFDTLLDEERCREAIPVLPSAIEGAAGMETEDGLTASPQMTPLYQASPAMSGASPRSASTPFSPFGPGSPLPGDVMFSPSPGSGAAPGQPSPYAPASQPVYSNAHPGYVPASPSYSPSSPAYTPSSPSYSPASPSYSPASPSYSPASPSYSPSSPSYSPSSPSYSPSSPSYSPSSPSYSPSSPSYSPSSPSYSPSSPSYSPSSPSYSPSSPSYSPSSPSYSPSSPSYSPSSPSYSPSSPSYSPSSPNYSPSSPSYSPSSPSYSPSSPSYSPSSPNYTPDSVKPAGVPIKSEQGRASPSYSPSSPAYTPDSAGSPASPSYSPSSPSYSPSSPAYTPDSVPAPDRKAP
ncbi:putative DNA-directed RNA polymerase II subunit 1 [Paratrimastix pyriformis]|uniref:DNA-directed RNA polymerase subunit n=1 Tax=Paratrimastix pyriformis TaxID=342808 RepID=A0ABQ8USU9_9EUKA|nr:putative DNA-directed RNA polymerase II subunit 1 [Paratrimastix pyriformis]